MLKQFIDSRWSPLVDLLCVIASGLLLSTRFPAWLSLITASLPWLYRLPFGRFPYRRTPFDIPLTIYLSTALIGVWAAYDVDKAIAKLWSLILALLIFYTLANQPLANLRIVAAMLSGCGLVIAGLFLLTHNWQDSPSRLAIVNNIATMWMMIRPRIVPGGIGLDPDVIGGITGLLLPFAAALLILFWRERRRGFTLIIATSTGTILFGLYLSAQRGAWLALGVASGLLLLWIASKRIASRTGISRQIIFGAIVGGLILTVTLIIAADPASIWDAATPGNRLEVARHTLALIQDFAFTGGGLAAYPGLYSRYILHIPWLFLQHSSNLFLDTAIDQGLLGLAALLIILAGCSGLLMIGPRAHDSVQQFELLHWATFASLIVVVIYGLFEDPFYTGWGTLFLLIPVGAGVALCQPRSCGGAATANYGLPNSYASGVVIRFGVGIGLIMATAALITAIVPALRSRWYANIGAVYLSRVEMNGFPGAPRYWGNVRRADLASAETLLAKSLELDPVNHTANYRLGLIATLRLDFSTAANYLESAYQTDPQHRGVQKMLAYSYVWTGRYAEAAVLLDTFPEAREELQTYSQWWSSRGRDALAQRADEMTQYLDSQ
jgi:tetratricopeptide (TPR) repeat protein